MIQKKYIQIVELFMQPVTEWQTLYSVFSCCVLMYYKCFAVIELIMTFNISYSQFYVLSLICLHLNRWFNDMQIMDQSFLSIF